MSVAEQKSLSRPSRSTSLNYGRAAPDMPYAQPSGQVVFENGQYHDRPAPNQASAVASSKNGLQELAGMRAQLLAIQRRLLEHTGKFLGWSIGWAAILPSLDQTEVLTEVDLEEVDVNPAEMKATDASEDVKLFKPTLGIAAGALVFAVSSIETFRQSYEVR